MLHIKKEHKMINTSNFLGFHSIPDFIYSLTRYKDYVFNSIPAIIASTTSFITGYMWDSAAAVYTLWILMGADWLTGIIKSIINKQFVSYRIFRMPLYYIATSFLMGISWWMSKTSIIFLPLPGLVIGGFYAVYFISLLENLGELGFLPKPLITALKNRFGLKSIIDKYMQEK